MTSLNEICVTKIALPKLLTCTSAVISKPFLLLTSPHLLSQVWLVMLNNRKVSHEMILKKEEMINDW